MGSCFIHSGTHPSPKSPKKDSIDAPEGDSPILSLQPALFQNNNSLINRKKLHDPSINQLFSYCF